MSEYDFEPIRGLPGVPPAGEAVIWQGAPDWWTLSCQSFHVRAAATYFAAMLTWRLAAMVSEGHPVLSALGSVLMVAPIALIALGTLVFFGWLNSRTTVYTITSRRVVMRFGAALTKSINIPFNIIESAALKTYDSGHGDLALTLKAPNKIAFLQLWPHVRPWKLVAPQPTFRAMRNAGAVADILANAMRSDVGVVLTRTGSAPREVGAGGVLGPARPQAA